MRWDLGRAGRPTAIAGWAALWVAAIPGAAMAAGRPKPNILVILADDLGHADLGFQGCRDIPTPHIDSLARCGVRCGNGYVSGPYCSPTRAGLLTGRYQQRFGHEFNPGPDREASFGLPLSETTLADRLKAAGYVTGLVGKWHLGDEPRFRPRRRGFDEFFGFLGGAHPYVPGNGAPIYRGDAVVAEKEYLTDAFGREAVGFVERHRDRPFFLYLAFNAVHTPMDATDARLARFAGIADTSRRTYAAMLAAMDESIGKVLDALRAARLEEDTLIFFLSDNGGPTMRGTTINASRNDPFRGSKRTTLEGGIHVPFVVQWKGSLPAGGSYDRSVIQLDILPTALAAAGVAARPEWQLDGVDLLPQLTGRSSAAPHDALYWRLGEQMAIRSGDWKLVRYDAAADRTDTVSVHSQVKVSPARLYNLADDPGERRDLAARHPETLAELSRAWQAWNARLARPLWTPRTRESVSPKPPATPKRPAARPEPEGASTGRDAPAAAFFEEAIRPLPVDQRETIDSAGTEARGGLRVEDRNGLIQGGHGGRAVMPGEPEDSLLLRAVRHDDGAAANGDGRQAGPRAAVVSIRRMTTEDHR